MTTHDVFEANLVSWLDNEAQAAIPVGPLDQALASIASRRPRPERLAGFGSHWIDGPHLAPAIGRPSVRMTYAFIVLGLILALIVAVLVAGAFRSKPYRAPTWTATGSMVTPRNGHTATLLLNGKVLVAGGSLGDPGVGYASLSSAELYDPASRTWAATGRMGARRSGHTATLLRDGRVLVAGDGSAELYDPASGTWTATGNMTTPHGGGTATLLRDGRVLVVSDGSAELYDPASGTWTATGNMTTPRTGGTATLLPDGKMLVAGGYDPQSSGLTLASAELYDPARGTWTATGTMATPRGQHTATLLTNGTVLVAGGGGGASSGCCAPFSPELPSAELYDAASGTWTATGEMKEVRSNHTATLLPTGDVFVTGSGDGDAVSPELYDPVIRSWTATSNSIEAHLYAETATLLPDGTVLVVGGSNGIYGTSGDAGMAGAELYDPGSGEAPSASASVPPPVVRPPVLTPPVATPSPSLAVTQPGAPRWTAMVTKFTQRRQVPTVTLLADGRVLVAGGTTPINADPGYEVLASAEILDPITGTSAATGSMVTPRSGGGGGTTTLLADGRVLVAGGLREVPAANGSGDSTGVTLASAELYDPVSGTWTATGSMVTPREGHTATLLRDGRVLVTGGREKGTSAELYDPASGSWTATGDMVTPGAWGQTATLLRDGRVLVVGGYGGIAVGTLSSAELYDPASGTWTATGSMARPRVGHTATLLPDGRVLVVGGDGGSAAALPLTSAELYDPTSGTWSGTGSMVTPRYGGASDPTRNHTATVLADGRVLVAGGSDFQVTPSCDLHGRC
jgi:WD40 repeat protein